MPEGERRADDLIAAAPARSWRKISAGPREYHWTRIPVRDRSRPGRGHWLLARRSLADPEEGNRHQRPGHDRLHASEIRRLLAKTSPQRPPGPEHAWSWSRWPRKRQYQARICHYQRRGHALT
jgi:hypothetical protein